MMAGEELIQCHFYSKRSKPRHERLIQHW